MVDFYDTVDRRLSQIEQQYQKIKQMNPVDALDQKKISDAKVNLSKRYNDLKILKETGQQYRKDYDAYELVKLKTTESYKNASDWNKYHEKLKQDFAQKYPGTYDSKKNIIDIRSWSEADKKKYLDSRKNRDLAIKINKDRQSEEQIAKEKNDQKAKEYTNLKQKVQDAFPTNNNISEPCTYCQLKSRRDKLARVKAVFPGQQSFGNCGIQSANQMMELVTCEKNDEARQLKKALKDGNAKLSLPTDKPEDINRRRKSGLNADEVNTIDKIGSTKNIGIELEKDKTIGKYYSTVNRDKYLDNGKIITTSSTGGAFPAQQQKIMQSPENPKAAISTSLKDPTIGNIETALKENKPVIVVTQTALLDPVYDENNKPIIPNPWTLSKDQTDADGNVTAKKGQQMVGIHSVMIADGKFDENKNLTHVLINDTGTGRMYYMKVSDLEKSMNDASRNNTVAEYKLVVSDKPINPDCH
ncbi:hypothetical protein [Spirosoma spitsbergense]|uniref:hypothetical protein n=1 Tax=Spirosoma spitsbergense TaxID=431554 RepID=UPI0003621EAE|nr:hypothetical protein [Spirosoma spitsbergense]